MSIEAIQLTTNSLRENPELPLRANVHSDEHEFEIFDYLHQTWVACKAGDFIIKGVKGEFYPCVKDVFEAKYYDANGGTSDTGSNAKSKTKGKTSARLARTSTTSKAGKLVGRGPGRKNKSVRTPKTANRKSVAATQPAA